jgi:hypothetical protein
LLCHGPGDHRRVRREGHGERGAGRIGGLWVAGQQVKQRIAGCLMFGGILLGGGPARRLASVGCLDSERSDDDCQVAVGVVGDLLGEADSQIVSACG